MKPNRGTPKGTQPDPNTMTTHHMYPRCRFPEYEHEPWNHKQVTLYTHRAWNAIFGNDATPHEALVKILDEWTPQNMRASVVEWLIHRERKV